MEENNVPNTLVLLDKLRRNAHLGKHKHFFAGSRSRQNHIYYGVPVVIINVLLGSLLFANLGEKIPNEMQWIGAIFALVAAMLSGIQTFFNFQKTFEAHRRAGNQYLAIARRCETLIAIYNDGLVDLAQIGEEIKLLNQDYNKVNTDAESFPTNATDYQKALEIEKAKELEKPNAMYDRVTLPPDTEAVPNGNASSANSEEPKIETSFIEIRDLNIEEIQSRIKDLEDIEVLENWLREEEKTKNRKGALEVLKHRIEILRKNDRQ